MVKPRGPLSEYLLDSFTKNPFKLEYMLPNPNEVQFCLYLCYELSYQGLVNADPAWEAEIYPIRRQLEQYLVNELSSKVKKANTLESAIKSDGISLSKWFLDTNDKDSFKKYVIQRSCYQLREADPHMLGILRFPPDIKQKLLEIQVGEYFPVAHSLLWAELMRKMDLNPELNGYIDEFSDITLKLMNLMSLFAFNARYSHELMGHLAAFEMTSVSPMSNYSEFAKRHGFPTEFFQIHVWADAEHGPMAKKLCESLNPERVNFGARALVVLEQDFAKSIIESGRP